MHFTFNRQAAVQYAHDYAFVPNIAYPNKWVKEGEDCTSFVSQCWHAAGIPTNTEWYCNTNDPDASASCWAFAPDFEYYMTSRGYCYILKIGDYDKASLGDVIQFHDHIQGWHHSAIITKITSGLSKQLYYSAHSDPHYDKALSEVSEVTRILHVCDEACW